MGHKVLRGGGGRLGLTQPKDGKHVLEDTLK